MIELYHKQGEKAMNVSPKIYTKVVNFKISPEEYEILKAVSEKEQTSSSDLFRSFIKQKQIENGINFSLENNQEQLF